MKYARAIIGMLDPIKISYKLTTNVSVTYYRIQQKSKTMIGLQKFVMN